MAHPDEPDSASTTRANTNSAWRQWLARDHYMLAGVITFLVIVVCCWTSFVETDEEIYFLGARRIVDPSLLALDFTWSRLPPTSAVFDHLVALLLPWMSPFAVANLGRVVFWALMAWSITLLARTLKLPAWCAVVGVATFLLWQQTLGTCGSPFEGFQAKSLAYPLVLFALVFVIRGQVVRAGLTAGLATAIHLIVGGWGCLALLLAMLANRPAFSFRRAAVFALASAPFIAPLLVFAALFAGPHVTHAVQARMDAIYASFAMPHCCDPDAFMTPLGWLRAGVVFAVALAVTFTWRERRAAKVLGAFLAALMAFFLVGVVARRLELYGVLKLYPFQLANALPALVVFLMVPAWLGTGGATRRIGRIGWTLALAGTAGLLLERRVPMALIEQPQTFASEIEDLVTVGADIERPLYPWIRKNTPRDAVFIAPLLDEFWPHAERAQVASMRHPPLDVRIIAWKERLEAINGFRPFAKRGFETREELDANERRLSIDALIRIRDTYGATHYLVEGDRADLADHQLGFVDGYSVYGLAGLTRPTP